MKSDLRRMKVTLSVSVPANWVDDITERAQEKGYANRSEYVRNLIQGDINEDEDTDITLIDGVEDGNGTTEEAA